MIISHKYKFIFFAIPKTGTHSIRIALRNHLGSEDLEQVDLFVKKRLPYPDIAVKKHGHISALEIKPHLTEDVWNSYYKFAFMRNPLDRFISLVFFVNRNRPGFEKIDVRQYMKLLVKKDELFNHMLFRKQSELISDEKGELMIDYIGGYDNLQDSFNTVCEKLMIPETCLTKTNPTKHSSFMDYYDDELMDAVQKRYEDDMSLFLNRVL